MIRRFGCLAILSVISAGCSDVKTSDRDLILVNPDQAVELAQGKKSLLHIGSKRGVYLDPRSEQEYAAGHIPGAINVPLGVLRDDFEFLKDYDTIVVYGNTYGDTVAEGSAKLIIELVRKKNDVRVLDGGLRAWEDAGKEIETGASG